METDNDNDSAGFGGVIEDEIRNGLDQIESGRVTAEEDENEDESSSEHSECSELCRDENDAMDPRLFEDAVWSSRNIE